MLIIEIITCDKCGKSRKVETDSRKFLEEVRKRFEKKHRGCKVVNKVT